MKDNLPQLIITEKQRDTLINNLSNLLNENSKLQQNLNQNILEKQVNEEKYLLEILEVFDAIESLLTIFQNQNPGINRIGKNLSTIQKKILNILKKRGVFLIDLKENFPDLNLCRVVDQEIRDDLEEKTITKIIRQGFQYQDKILRPTEVIISQKSPLTN